MTEEEARGWLEAHFDVPRGTWSRLETLVDGVIQDSQNQNLIAASTISQIWARHIVDSAQLLLHGHGARNWMDVGSGAGFPGLVIAAFTDIPVALVEPRRKRIDFLTEMAGRMNLANRVEIIGQRVEMAAARPFSAISARAFAPLDRIFELTTKFSTEETQWVLPKGRSAQDELAQARRTWQGNFRIEPSVTDPEAGVIVAANVRPKSLAAGKAR